MKKLLSVILLVTMLLAVLASCNTKPEFKKLFNPEWSAPTQTLTQKKDLSITGTLQDSNTGLSIIASVSDTNVKTTSVFSHYTNEVVKKVTDSDTEKYTVTLLSTTRNNAFVVKKETTENLVVTKTTATLYDAKGNELASFVDDEIPQRVLSSSWDGSTTYEYIFKYTSVNSLFSFGDVIYTEKEDGSLQKVKEADLTDIPEVANLNEYLNEKYYKLTSQTATVYNSNFETIFYYEMPHYANGDIFVLPGGNLLVQYTVRLPDDASKYDLLESQNKYEMKLYTVSIEDGSEKAITSGGYIIRNVSVIKGNASIPSFMKDLYAEEFEAMAVVYPIGEDKRVDTADTAADYLIIDAKGTLGSSMKFDKNHRGTPTPIGNGKYAVQTVYGETHILNEKGEKLFATSQYINLYDLTKYILTDLAIYDLEGAKVYDLKENKMEVVGEVGDSIVLKSEGDNETAYHLFKDGATTLIGKVYITGGDNATDAIKSVDCGGDFYIVYKGDKYNYYNEKGEELLSTEYYMNSTACRDGYLLYDTNNNFYKFLFDNIIE